MTLFFCIPGANAMSYPKIEVIKDNTDYLLIHEKSLPIVDIEYLLLLEARMMEILKVLQIILLNYYINKKLMEKKLLIHLKK